MASGFSPKSSSASKSIELYKQKTVSKHFPHQERSDAHECILCTLNQFFCRRHSPTLVLALHLLKQRHLYLPVSNRSNRGSEANKLWRKTIVSYPPAAPPAASIRTSPSAGLLTSSLLERTRRFFIDADSVVIIADSVISRRLSRRLSRQSPTRSSDGDSVADQSPTGRRLAFCASYKKNEIPHY